MSKFKYLSTDRWSTSVDRNPNHIQEELFTPLESPGIYAGDAINREHQLLVKAGTKPHLSNGVYSQCLEMIEFILGK